MFKSDALENLHYFTESKKRSKNEMLMLFNTKFGDLTVPKDEILLPHLSHTDSKWWFYQYNEINEFYRELAEFPEMHRTVMKPWAKSRWYSDIESTRLFEFGENLEAFMNLPFKIAMNRSKGPCVYIISKSSRLKSKAPDSLIDLEPLYVGQSGNSGQVRLTDFENALMGYDDHNAAGRMLNRICNTRKILPHVLLPTLEVTIINVSKDSVSVDLPQMLEACIKTKFKRAGKPLLNIK